MLAALLFSVVAQTASAAPQPVQVDGATAYVYKTAGPNQLRLHVFQTKRAGPNPAILFFFGGAWMQGNVTQFAPQARHLSQRGMVAILVDYRVLNRHGTTPFAAMADARSALRWVRSQARQLGIDPNRIAAAGGSSGGHLALSAAVFDTFDERGEDPSVSAKPNALVLFNPAVDTSANRLFGDRGRDGSPLHHVRAGLPPTLIMHGKADMTVPYALVDQFCSEAKALGNQCRLVGYDGAPHGFFNPRAGDDMWYRETLLEADRFLTTLGYLPAPSKRAPGTK
jgi:acetyl esterase/lipase